ncbi:gamma-glutamyltransferase [Rhodovibrionaceae bacterium A322]
MASKKSCGENELLMTEIQPFEKEKKGNAGPVVAGRTSDRDRRWLSGLLSKGPFGRKSASLSLGLKGLVATLMIGALAACGDSNPNKGEVAVVEGFAGLVAADEPNTTLVGRDILARNGTAFDAAVAMSFTLAVTQPSRAGLGSGGACILFSREAIKAEALLFPPQLEADGGVVPETARAMALMHARYGTQRWELLLNPAERMARFGFPVSRAFVKDLQASRFMMDGNPALAKLYRKANGEDYRVGDRLEQLNLSTSLSGVRQRGGGYLYKGGFARRLVAEAKTVGVHFDEATIRNNLPEMIEPLEQQVGNHVLFLPPPPATGGVSFAQLWQMLVEVKDWDGADRDGYRIFAEAQDRVFADRANWLGADGRSRVALSDLTGRDRARSLIDESNQRSGTQTDEGAVPSTGFVVGDRFGNAVTCSFTMNHLFGSGKVLPGSGLVLAAPPPASLGNAVPLSVALVGNKNTGRVTFAASGSDSAGTAASLFTVAFAKLELDLLLEEAVKLPRVRLNEQGTLFYEPGVPVNSLGGWALGVREVPDPTHVSAFFCPYDLEGEEGIACVVEADPRSDGLAVIAR